MRSSPFPEQPLPTPDNIHKALLVPAGAPSLPLQGLTVVLVVGDAQTHHLPIPFGHLLRFGLEQLCLCILRYFIVTY